MNIIKKGRELLDVIYPDSDYECAYISNDNDPDNLRNRAIQRAEIYGMKLQLVLSFKVGKLFAVFERHSLQKRAQDALKPIK